MQCSSKMGSKYVGDQNYGSSSSSSSSSRKGKKNSSDKPKQPQRGLGVAQLEKIRLHTELGSSYLPNLQPYAAPSTFNQEDLRMQTASSSSFSYSSSISSPTYGFQANHGIMMGLPDIDRASITYGDSQSSSVARWNPGYGTQHFVEPSMTRSFIEPAIRGSQSKKDRKDIMGSSSPNSESSNSQELDLELRLSL